MKNVIELKTASVHTDLLIVQWIVNGVREGGDEVRLGDQRRTLLNQKLRL